MKTNKTSRGILVAGNWKMNCDVIMTKNLLTQLLSCEMKNTCKVVVCVPAVNLCVASDMIKNTNISLGAQNCHWEDCGAFTGEISPKMLLSVGTEYVIVGHSERRTLFGETDSIVNKRLIGAVSSGLKTILCVGENQFERENNIAFERLSLQVKLGLLNVSRDMMKDVIIAYEPVWAIGTNKSASADQANEACAHIRSVVREIYDDVIAENIFIQYGGSLNSKNAYSLFSKPDIDGGLIGGASLKADEFKEIIKVAISL